MGSGHTLNPNGGVLFRRGLEIPTQARKTRLRPGDLDEPPYADPLVGWCGGWGRKTPGYPISRHTYFRPIAFFKLCLHLKITNSVVLKQHIPQLKLSKECANRFYPYLEDSYTSVLLPVMFHWCRMLEFLFRAFKHYSAFPRSSEAARLIWATVFPSQRVCCHFV